MRGLLKGGFSRITTLWNTLIQELSVYIDTIPYATSFRRRFFAYHHAVNHPHTNIILSWLSIPLVLKCAAKKLKIGLQIGLDIVECPKMFLNRDFALAREIIQTSLTLDSGKFVNFIQTFGHLVSFPLMLVLWIFNKILEILIFSGKIVTSLARTFSMQNPYSKTFFGR